MTEIPTSTRAVVLEAPGPPEALQIRDVPVPVPEPGQVLIKVEAFGTNRSELHTRLGLADGVTFPRVLGIEAGVDYGADLKRASWPSILPDLRRCLSDRPAIF